MMYQMDYEAVFMGVSTWGNGSDQDYLEGPPCYHLMVEDDRTFSLSIDEPVDFSRPSIDVLFGVAVEVYDTRAIGMIPTGAKHDGSTGMREIKKRGGFTIVQDPSMAYASSMPKAAIDSAEVHLMLQLQEVVPFLMSIGHAESLQFRTDASDH